MTVSPRLYLRRTGSMVFWRIGRLGGSIYLSSMTTAARDAAKEQRTVAVAQRRAADKNLRAAIRIAERNMRTA